MAAIGGGCGGGSGLRMSGLGQNESVMYNSKCIDSVFISGSSSSFMGCSSMVSFEDVCGGKMSERPFFGSFDHEENGDEDLDDYFQQPAKKRRLTTEQVQFLERSFEAENKLEPERKIQLAKDLGLQPRQVAIWFQNRRARWKTKRLEKDYDALQASYNSLKADYENLLKEKEELKAEVLHLTDKMQLKGKEQEDSDPSNTQNILPKTPPQDPIAESASEVEDHRPGFQPYKQEDLSSTRSDVFDSEYSPRYIDGGHSSFEEPGDSSYVFEPAQSDVSLDEESDNLSKTLLPPSSYDSRMIRTVDYHPDPPSDSCNFGFTVEDQALWFWAY